MITQINCCIFIYFLFFCRCGQCLDSAGRLLSLSVARPRKEIKTAGDDEMLYFWILFPTWRTTLPKWISAKTKMKKGKKDIWKLVMAAVSPTRQLATVAEKKNSCQRRVELGRRKMEACAFLISICFDYYCIRVSKLCTDTLSRLFYIFPLLFQRIMFIYIMYIVYKTYWSYGWPTWYQKPTVG